MILGEKSAAQSHSDILALPTVACSNIPVVPAAHRQKEYPVVSYRCTCCTFMASGPGHQPVGMMQFPDKEQYAMFVHAHYIGDDDDDRVL